MRRVVMKKVFVSCPDYRHICETTDIPDLSSAIFEEPPIPNKCDLKYTEFEIKRRLMNINNVIDCVNEIKLDNGKKGLFRICPKCETMFILIGD